MSEKSASQLESSIAVRADRRVQRTRDTLGNVLLELMQQQSFDSITVQQVIDRAGVSRSTFYTHYRDKNDLFLSDVEEFLQWISTLLSRRGAPAHRLFPVEELFSHIAEMSGVREAIKAAGKGEAVRELGVGCFARSIKERLILAGVKIAGKKLDATAQSFSGSLFSLLEWWLGTDKSMTPKDLDTHFHLLAWNGLGGEPRPFSNKLG